MTAIMARDLADRLRLKKYPKSWRGDCFCCSYSGSLSVQASSEGNARLFCSNGCDRGTLLKEAARVTGGTYEPKVPLASSARSNDDRAEYARTVWARCRPLTDRTSEPGVAYLRGRGIEHVAGSPHLRFHDDLKHPEGGSLAALVALARSVDGEPVGLQRIYLTRDGSAKAGVTPAKAGLGVLWGAAVRLQEPIDGAIVIGEGVETSAAAGLLLGLPAWAAISAGNLAKGLMLPVAIRRITIAADNDLPHILHGRKVWPGQDAARAAARRWRAEGRSVEIATPDLEGTDFADVLAERRG
ncbi:DUF7146 domain-containing protein [Acidisoma cladoniae]|uniref:DUF7146 domain-containing protein n=1 Tax=Acidisoma cladoniae TaxID=3040935 RepID=UPI00254D7DF3|nr:toprim domain-containing protein [Acidisoma sp. PAMC 29798]